jgi:hypothetical protein
MNCPLQALEFEPTNGRRVFLIARRISEGLITQVAQNTTWHLAPEAGPGES